MPKREGKYRSKPEADDWGHIGTVVFVPRNGKHRTLESSGDISPDGHGWGYAGSGPTQLARDILEHYTGRLCKPDVEVAFKFEIIARLPKGQWEISTETLSEWLNGKAAKGAK